MKINITKETLQKAGEVSLRVGKRIIIEGTKAVVLKGTIATMEAKFEGKPVTLDAVLGEDKKVKQKKKGFFKRKKDLDESEVSEQITDAYIEGVKDGLDAGVEAAAVIQAVKSEED